MEETEDQLRLCESMALKDESFCPEPGCFLARIGRIFGMWPNGQDVNVIIGIEIYLLMN